MEHLVNIYGVSNETETCIRENVGSKALVEFYKDFELLGYIWQRYNNDFVYANIVNDEPVGSYYIIRPVFHLTQ